MADSSIRRARKVTVTPLIVSLAFAWTLVVGGSLWWNVYHNDQQARQSAQQDALSIFGKERDSHLWGTKHGGVYVPITQETPPSPYVASYLEQLDTQTIGLTTSHGIIWLLGLLGIFGSGRSIQNSLRETRRAEAEVRALNSELENRVEERTRELSEQSKRLTTTIDNAADGIIVIDEDGMIDTFNAAASQLFGYTEKECLGKPVSILMPEPHASNHNKFVKKYLLTGQSTIIGTGREVKARHKEGAIFPIYVAISKIELPDRVLFSGIVRDLTKEKDAERELRSAKGQAERANQAKSEFLASMSHELRTPLNGIIGFSQLMRHIPDEPLSKNQTAYSQMITEAGEHLLSLINDILDFARIETEGFSLSIESIDPVAAMENCLTLIVPVAEKHHVTLKGGGTLPALPMVLADEVRFKQVLMNLLSNAAKYNEPGGKIYLNADVRGERVRFSVTDTGPGIPEDLIDDLFEPFNRLGQEAGNIEGTGIGLTITRQLVKRMGGEMDVDSTLGQGSTFWFELPISHKALSPQKTEKSGGGAVLIPPTGHKRILYIEDNAHNRALMGEIFKPFTNLELVTATRGEDGVSMAIDLLPDLVLVDINLPGIDGFEALRRMQGMDKTRHIPVIAVSANALPRDLRKGQKAPFKAYLTKPLDIGRVKKIVFSVLKEHSAKNEKNART